MLAAAIVLQGATAPGQTVGISVFVDELAGDLDLSRSAVSSAYLVGTLTGALAMPAAGKLIDRRGLRFATLAFGAAFGAMLVAMAGVVGFVSLALGFAGTRALGQGALTLTATTTVAVWFEDRRGLATGIKTAAGGALMGLVPLVSAWLIATVGWRSTWVILGFGAWIVVLPLGYWLVSNPHRPAPRDPSGHDPALASSTAPGSVAPSDAAVPSSSPTTSASSPSDATTPSSSFSSSSHTPPSWPVAAVIRHPAFLAMAAASALAALVATGLMFHHVDLLAVRGLTTAQAAAVFLPLTLASAVGAIAAGRGVDRLSPRLLTSMALVALAASPLVVQVVHPGVTAAAYGALLGAVGAAIRTIEASTLPRWFGIDSIGQIRGWVMAAAVGASAAGPLIISVGVDLTGDYTAVLRVLSAVSLALAALVLTVKPPSRDVSPAS